jgi:N-methylhydantoinase B
MPDFSKLQVLIDHTQAITESMAITLYRTAHSTFVRETEDFTTGLVTLQGETFACPKNFGATWFAGLNYKTVIDWFRDYQEGDICITNDPYSGFVATHSPDIHIWKPVFLDGELVCFAVGHVHNTDMGGAVPASLSRTLTEVQQEGIRIPPAKLYRAGQLNEQVLELILANVRSPEQNWGDLKALVAAVNTGAEKVTQLASRHGAAEFKQGCDQILAYAEQQARDLIISIPDGSYEFHDYIDEDAVDGFPCRLSARMTVNGSTMVFDFSGSDPQAASSINMPTGGHERHALLLIAVYYAFFSLQPDITVNGGLIRPISCITRRGSVLDPQYPAAVGLRSLTALRVQDVILGCFAAAIPDRMPSAASGSVSIINVLAYEPRLRRQVIAAIAPMVGGGGGWNGEDGSNGAGGNAGYLKNTPVEINELEVPIEIRRYCLASDSGGAGKYRGGLGLSLEFEVRAIQAVATARNRDRSRFQPWGIRSGHAGAKSRFLLNPGTPEEKELRNADLVQLSIGDIVSITSSGGGGWGESFDRSTESIEDDVRRGYISEQAARELYGVVLRDGVTDHEETRKLRALPRRESEKSRSFGMERVEFERKFPEQSYGQLLKLLQDDEPSQRAWIKKSVMKRLVNVEAVSEDDVSAAYCQVKQQWDVSA